MRNLLLFSVLLLGASWMAAQTSTASGQGTGAAQSSNGQTTHQTATGNQKTVTGCLSESNGKYMLTERNGTSYELMGESSKLAEHVGHEIRVTGTEAAASGTASSTMGQNASPTLEVSSFRHISKTCKSGGNTGNSGGMSH
jgi:Protein of unknown function (DUF5818)